MQHGRQANRVEMVALAQRLQLSDKVPETLGDRLNIPPADFRRKMNKRRKFLGFLTFAAVLPYLPARAAPVARPGIPQNDNLTRLLLELVPDNPAARRLGRAILDDLPSPGTTAAMSEQLFSGIGNTQSVTPDMLRHYLEDCRRADFAAGDTITSAGWILCRSEANALALVAAYRAG
jgi:hypothetical protein